MEELSLSDESSLNLIEQDSNVSPSKLNIEGSNLFISK